MIAKRHPIKLKEIELWAKGEGEIEKFQIFKNKLSGEKL